ncbi:hypothetical protein AB4Z54_75235, partial [Streptomyces sp. MCAF7]
AVARAGDAVPEPFAGVRTLRRTATTAALRLRAQRHTEAVTEAAAQAATETVGQTVTESAASPATEIVTELSDGQGLLVVHRLTHRPGDPFVRIRTSAANEGDRPFALDLISSFTLSGITP